MEDIERRLLDEYLACKYDVLMGHSCGCFMITRLLPHLLDTQKPKTTIFLNPFICNTWMTKCLGVLPHWISCMIPLLKWSGISGDTFSHQSIWSMDEWRCNNVQLINYAAKNMFFDKFIKTYSENKITIIYGECDPIATIPPNLQMALRAVTKFITIYAKHEPFKDDMVVQQNLKNIIMQELYLAI